jgi:hypothetical protein
MHQKLVRHGQLLLQLPGALDSLGEEALKPGAYLRITRSGTPSFR